MNTPQLNSKQKKTLKQVFQKPISKSVEWNDIVSLVNALGGRVVQCEGSRYLFYIEDTPLHIHRPHPDKEMKQYSVKLVRRFLESLEITP